MNVDAEIVAFVLRSADYRQVRKAGIRPEHVRDKGGEHFKVLHDYYTQYRKVPSVQDFAALVGEDQEDLLEGGRHPLEFYVKEIRSREIELIIRANSERINKAVLAGKSEGVIELFREVYRKCSTVLSREKSQGRSELLRAAQDRYSLAEQSEDGVIGYRMPWATLNAACGGHELSDFIVFLGKPGMGKTFLLLQMVLSAVKQQRKSILISMEMPKIALVNRLVSAAAGISLKGIRSGKLSPDVKKRFDRYADALVRSDYLTLADSGEVKTTDDVKIIQEDTGAEISFIDSFYKLQPFGSYGGENYVRMLNVSSELRAIALELNILVVATHQFSGSQESGQLDADLDNAALAKMIGWDASHVYAVTANKSMEKEGRRRLTSLKVREGDLSRVDIHYKPDQGLFSELSTRGDVVEVDDLDLFYESEGMYDNMDEDEP